MHLWLALANPSQSRHIYSTKMLTQTPFAFSVDARAADEHVIDHGENAFAAYPLISFTLELTVIQHSCFVKLNPSTVDGLSEGNLGRVEVLPA